MKRKDKRSVSFVSPNTLSPIFLFLTQQSTAYCVLSCLYRVRWKCLDFDIFLEDRQSGLPPFQRFLHCSAEGSEPQRFS